MLKRFSSAVSLLQDIPASIRIFVEQWERIAALPFDPLAIVQNKDTSFPQFDRCSVLLIRHH